MPQPVWEFEGDPGRVVFLTNSIIVLPVATYKSLSLTNRVTFQVDMRALIELSQFDPASHNLFVIGNFNDWRELYMGQSSSGIYRASFPIITVRPGEPLRFYFSVNVEFPESVSERVVILEGGTQVIPPFYFSDVLPSTDAGYLTIKSGPSGKVTLTWLSAPDQSLQTSQTMGTNTWTTVPDSLGQSTSIITVTPARNSFALRDEPPRIPSIALSSLDTVQKN